jgi:nucleotide-binding universal stress UspA family protein
MIKHLLIPLDGTPMAEAVLPAAARLTEKAGAQVTLLHVLEKDAPATVHGATHLRSAPDAEAYLKQVAANSFPPAVRVNWHVHERQVPDVAHSLADHVDEMAPDLVVMSTHNEGGLRDWISGNIAQQVVHLGVKPVLLLRPAASGQVVVPFRTILLPLDGQPDHEQGIPPAAAIAQLCEAAIRLLMIVPTAHSLSGTDAAVGSLLPESTRIQLDLAEKGAAEYLLEHLMRLWDQGICTSACVDRGDPASQIVDHAKKAGADLIVLGTHGKAGTQAFWEGSMAQRLLRRIPASFLLVPISSTAASAPA